MSRGNTGLEEQRSGRRGIYLGMVIALVFCSFERNVLRVIYVEPGGGECRAIKRRWLILG